MTSPVYTPLDRTGWWQGADRRPRCSADGRVAFVDQKAAEHSAGKIRQRSVHDPKCVPAPEMQAYQGECGNWHVGEGRKGKKK